MAAPSHHNRGSTPGNDNDNWRTPPHIYEGLGRLLGYEWIADMAADINSTIVPNCWFGIEESPLTIGVDVIARRLAACWGDKAFRVGSALWCNPPYGSTKLDDWIAKAREVSLALRIPWVTLCPASRVEQPWFYAYPPEEYFLVFIKKRIDFLTPEGVPNGKPNHPSLAIVFPGYSILREAPGYQRLGRFLHFHGNAEYKRE